MAKKATKKVLAIETKYGSFHFIFEPEQDMGGYTVEAKGVQGAISWGKNFNEAKRMIIDAVDCSNKRWQTSRANRMSILPILTTRALT